jgi:hypothetical protein
MDRKKDADNFQMVLDSWSNWNLEMLIFAEGKIYTERKTGGPGEKPSWQERKPTNNSTHM